MSRSQEFLTGQRPLLLSDLEPHEQQTAFGLVNDLSMSAPKIFNDRVAKATAAGKDVSPRLAEAARTAVSKPYVHEESIGRRVNNIEKAATSLRIPGDPSIAGGEFYFDANKELKEAQGNSNIPIKTVSDASSKLSVNNKPEAEHGALTAMVGAHDQGTVKFTPKAIRAIHSVNDSQGQRMYTVPKELKGQTVKFSDLDPTAVTALKSPKIRDQISHALSGVDVAGIAKGGINSNIRMAHRVLQGENLVDPYKSPKQTSYSDAKQQADHASQVHQEFQLRQAHLAAAIRGDVAGNQEMIDYHGLRDSNEGALSNRALTPADIHEKRTSQDQPHPAAYAEAGDLNLTNKTLKSNDPDVPDQTLGANDSKITAIGIEHAVHQDAVHQAAQHLQDKYNLGYTVPAAGVQAGNWAATRRETGGDDAYNAHLKAHEDSVNAAHEEALQEHAERMHNRSQQMSLF